MGGVLVACAGLAVLLLSRVDWPGALAALLAIPLPVALLALALCALSYVGLAGFDVVAVRTCPELGLSTAQAFRGGAVAYGISNFLGFPWMTGAAVRQRIYRLRPGSLGALATIVGSGWLAFDLSVALICGLCLLLAPGDIPFVPDGLRLPLGVLATGGAALAVLALGRGRSLRIAGREMRLLSRRLTLQQMGCAALDLAASALVLYVLLPEALRGHFAGFLGLFVLAIGIGVLSHVPAGLGSFEAVMVLGLDAGHGPELSAGLLAYRFIRTVLPFVLAAAVLLAVEGRGLGRSVPQ